LLYNVKIGDHGLSDVFLDLIFSQRKSLPKFLLDLISSQPDCVNLDISKLEYFIQQNGKLGLDTLNTDRLV